MSAEAIIRATSIAVCAVAGVYGAYKAHKFFSNLLHKVTLVKQIEANVEKLHAINPSVKDEKLREFMVGLEIITDVLKRIELDFSSVTEGDLQITCDKSSAMLEVYKLGKE